MSTQTQTTSNQGGAPPIAKIRVGLVTASIWERQAKNGTFYTVSFDRRYRDADGNWQTSHSYEGMTVLALAKAADLAQTKILELEAAQAA